MIMAYINYPNTHVKLHSPACGQVGKHRKAHQRSIKLNVDTLSDELRRFRDGKYEFG